MDLLNKIDKAKKEVSAKAVEASSAASDEGEAVISLGATSDKLKRGQDLLGKAAKTEVTELEQTETKVHAEEKTSDDKTVKDPNTWTKDSALKEVTKLREENKAIRTKYQEQLDKIAAETESKIAKIQEQYKDAVEAKKKLEQLEAAQEDKKRSIEEKLADREAKIAALEHRLEAAVREKEKEVDTYKSKALQYEAEQEARREVYRSKIKEELGKIPEEFRSFADKMVKGYEDPHEAWLAIAEAQRMGMFGDKKIVVNHSVPGAADGARVNKAKAEAEEREARKKMDSKSLIRAGLDKALKGQNSAFRIR